jgi:hypothetical protein
MKQASKSRNHLNTDVNFQTIIEETYWFSPQKPYHFFSLNRNGDQRKNPQPYYLIQPDTVKNKVIRLISSGKLSFLVRFGVGK